MSGQWEAVSLDLWPGVCSILLPWDRPPRPPLTLITAETCPPCPPRARVPRHFIATASYFTPSTSQRPVDVDVDVEAIVVVVVVVANDHL